MPTLFLGSVCSFLVRSSNDFLDGCATTAKPLSVESVELTIFGDLGILMFLPVFVDDR